jgi:hypothetical protein
VSDDVFPFAEQSHSLSALASALAKAQSEMSGASKDKVNPHFKSAYADLASVWDACRGPLSKNGLAVLQPASAQGPTVTVRTILVHSSGEWIASDLRMTAVQATPQGIGSCITYARRYALASLVGIAPEDDDGNAASTNGPVKVPEGLPRAMSPIPDGFAEWWADLQAVADNGTTELEQAFLNASKELRAYLVANHREPWERVKAKAKAVTAKQSATTA